MANLDKIPDPLKKVSGMNGFGKQVELMSALSGSLKWIARSCLSGKQQNLAVGVFFLDLNCEVDT